MLLIPTAKEYTWKMYNVMNNKYLEKKIMVTHDKRFGGSLEGWLVTVEEDYTVKFYKPILVNKEDRNNPNRIVHLPCLFPPAELLRAADIELRGLHILSTTIVTINPIENPDDFLVVVRYGEFSQLAFIRPSKDTKWIPVDVGERIPFYDVVYYKDKFYAINIKGKVIAFDVINSPNLNINLVKGQRSAKAILGRRYLVKYLEEELLIVERYSKQDINYNRRVFKFKVFKLDLKRSRWIKIKSLGKTALFLGDNSSISINASNFDGCQHNCIYGSHGPCDLGVYNLESGIFVWRYNIELDVIATMNKRPPVWLVPTINAY
ncbi:hypothetical protein UlMin_045542 [Ulmus minor]